LIGGGIIERTVVIACLSWCSYRAKKEIFGAPRVLAEVQKAEYR
jgi:hypothetical protein